MMRKPSAETVFSYGCVLAILVVCGCFLRLALSPMLDRVTQESDVGTLVAVRVSEGGFMSNGSTTVETTNGFYVVRSGYSSFSKGSPMTLQRCSESGRWLVDHLTGRRYWVLP